MDIEYDVISYDKQLSNHSFQTALKYGHFNNTDTSFCIMYAGSQLFTWVHTNPLTQGSLMKVESNIGTSTK